MELTNPFPFQKNLITYVWVKYFNCLNMDFQGTAIFISNSDPTNQIPLSATELEKAHFV